MTVFSIVTHYNFQVFFCITAAQAAGPHSEFLPLIMLVKCYTLLESLLNFIIFFSYHISCVSAQF